ncbi:MAG: hypothetical protein JW765_12325 [Deltaproteobacteria bacterium]|nr:hypothetical protein [Candidatus Zymogenaceae bacterium]
MNHRLPAIAACCLLLLAVFPSAVGAEANVKAVIGADGVQLKERPDFNAKKIIGISEGEAVLVVLCLKDPETALGIKGHWCLVRYRGIEGWVFDTVLDTKDPKAETSYSDVPSLSGEIGKLERLRESRKLEDMENLSALIIDQIEHNFSREDIGGSARLSGDLLASFSGRIEALVYLQRFDEAHKAYSYVMETYPDIKPEVDFITARELLQPYMVFMECYRSAPLFSDPIEPMKKVRAALEKRDLSLVSKLAVPGVFEVWVAHTDWVVRLGDREVDRQEWLSGSWDTSWEIKEVSPRIDEVGNLIGYCIVTEPWDLNYFEIRVNRVDFCVDRLPDGTYAFSYMTLYTEPMQ